MLPLYLLKMTMAEQYSLIYLVSYVRFENFQNYRKLNGVLHLNSVKEHFNA